MQDSYEENDHLKYRRNATSNKIDIPMMNSSTDILGNRLIQPDLMEECHEV
jgi:hypothetical protein